MKITNRLKPHRAVSGSGSWARSGSGSSFYIYW